MAAARIDRGQGQFAGGDQAVTAHDQIGGAAGQAGRLNISLARCDPHMGGDCAAFLRHAKLIDGGKGLALQMGGHG